MDEARISTQESLKSSKNQLQTDSFEHIADICGITTDKTLTTAMECESMDNLSVVIISYASFSRYLGELGKTSI